MKKKNISNINLHSVASSIFSNNNYDATSNYYNESTKYFFVGYAKSIISANPEITLLELLKSIMEV